MKAKKFHDMTSDELIVKARELKEELFNLRFQMATGQLDNPMRLQQVRKDIARAKTVQKDKEIKAAKKEMETALK